MNTTKTRLAAGFALATAFVLGSAPRLYAQGGPPAKDVVVVNTPANPVPVRSVDKDVVVTNTAANPALVRNVDEGSRQPFQRPFALQLAATEDSGEATYAVPAGKRWVIEYASMRASLFPDQTVFVNIVTTVAGQDAFHPVLVADQGMYGALHLQGAAQQMRVYADPGTTVRVQFAREPSGGLKGDVAFSMTLSGYRVDVP